MTIDATTRSFERLLIGLLIAVQFTLMVDFVMLIPLGAQLTRELQLTASQFSMVVSAYAYSAAIAGIVAALFVDRFDRRHALLATYAGFVAATAGCALSPNFSALLVARTATGAFGGVAGALVFSIIGDAIPYQRRGAATGAVMASFSIASIIGIPIGLWIAEKISWNASFGALCAFSMPVFLVAWRLPRMTGHLSKHSSAYAALRDVFAKVNHLRAFALTAMMIIAGFTVIAFMPQYLVDNVGLPEHDLKWIYLFGGIFTVVTNNLVGRLADRFGKHRLFYITTTASVVPILLITHLGSLPPAWALACTTFFIILVSSRFVPLMAIITAAVPAARRGSFMSVNSSVQSLSLGFASNLAGHIVTRDANGALLHYPTAGYIATAATIACLFMARGVKAVAIDARAAGIEPATGL